MKSNLCKTLVVAGLFTMLGLAGQTARASEALWDTGDQVMGTYVDPYTGRLIVRTDRQVVLPSAMDPNRNIIDPGSYQVVNYTQRDAYTGVLWHYTGSRWTSYGVPHSTITRRAISHSHGACHSGGVSVIQNQTQIRSQPYPYYPNTTVVQSQTQHYNRPTTTVQSQTQHRSRSTGNVVRPW